MLIKDSQQLLQAQKKYQSNLDKQSKKVMICFGTGCVANGAEKIADAFKEGLDKKKIKGFTIEAIKETLLSKLS